MSRELLDPVAKAVNHIQVIIAVHRDARRAVQLTVSYSRAAPHAQETAIFVEDGDPIEPFIGDVDILLAVQGEPSGPDELTITFSVSAELADELFVAWHGPNGEFADPAPVAVGHKWSLARDSFYPAAKHIRYVAPA